MERCAAIHDVESGSRVGDAQRTWPTRVPRQTSRPRSSGTRSVWLSTRTGSPANALAPNETLTVQFTGSVNGGIRNGSSMVDTATVTSYASLPATTAARTYPATSTTAAVNALSPALVVAKSVVGDANPLQGDTVHYLFTVRNVGHRNCPRSGGYRHAPRRLDLHHRQLVGPVAKRRGKPHHRPRAEERVLSSLGTWVSTLRQEKR